MLEKYYFVGVIDDEDNSEAIGFFDREDDACIRIEANQYDMSENGAYPYAVVEEVQSHDIYPYTKVLDFYTWIDGKYVKTDIPDKFSSLSGFTVR